MSTTASLHPPPKARSPAAQVLDWRMNSGFDFDFFCNRIPCLETALSATDSKITSNHPATVQSPKQKRQCRLVSHTLSRALLPYLRLVPRSPSAAFVPYLDRATRTRDCETSPKLGRVSDGQTKTRIQAATRSRRQNRGSNPSCAQPRHDTTSIQPQSYTEPLRAQERRSQARRSRKETRRHESNRLESPPGGRCGCRPALPAAQRRKVWVQGVPWCLTPYRECCYPPTHISTKRSEGE